MPGGADGEQQYREVALKEGELRPDIWHWPVRLLRLQYWKLQYYRSAMGGVQTGNEYHGCFGGHATSGTRIYRTA